MSVTGQADSAERQPQKVGVALTDIMIELYASNAILAVLAERERSQLGQHIDLSLFNVNAGTSANQASNYLVGDRHIVLTVDEAKQFTGFAEVLSKEELSAEARFSTNTKRVENRNRSELV